MLVLGEVLILAPSLGTAWRRSCPKAYHLGCIGRDEAFFTKKGAWFCGTSYRTPNNLPLWRIINRVKFLVDLHLGICQLWLPTATSRLFFDYVFNMLQGGISAQCALSLPTTSVTHVPLHIVETVWARLSFAYCGREEVFVRNACQLWAWLNAMKPSTMMGYTLTLHYYTLMQQEIVRNVEKMCNGLFGSSSPGVPYQEILTSC